MVLTLWGSAGSRFCDGIARRDFLRIGALGLSGIGGTGPLAQAFGNGAQPAANGKSVIMIYLPGGPTQHETFDPKPNAAREIRGSFGDAATAIPGVRFCELIPRLAKVAPKFSVVRSLVGMSNRHESFQCYTGRPGGRNGDNEPAGGWPTFGSFVSHVQGARDGMAPYIDASPKMSYGPYNNRGQHDAAGKSSWPGFTGRRHTPLALEGDVKSDLELQGVDLSRLTDRRDLLAALGNIQRRWDVDGHDSFQNQAFGLLTSNGLARALDLSQEDPKTRERYGVSQATHPSFGGAPQDPGRLLLARRLVEAGVRCVTVAFGAWDWHANREGTIEFLSKKYLPVFDHAIATLIEDLDERGLLEHVSIVVMGEFGRTPRINAKGGRDHWPSTQSILLAGGGIQGGRVIGSTDRTGGVPASRPVHIQEVFATLYRSLEIDCNQVKIPDLNGRPRYLVDNNRQPIPELL